MKFVNGREVHQHYQEVQSNLETPKMWKSLEKYPNKKTSINLLVKILCGNVLPIFNSWTYANGTTR